MGLRGFIKRPSSKPVMRSIPAAAPPTPEPAAPALDPQELRQQLFAAAVARDGEKLTWLGQQYEKSIFDDEGLIWSNLPPAIQANPAFLHWYSNGLKAIAGFCAQRLKKPELVERFKEVERQFHTKLTPQELEQARQRLQLPSPAIKENLP
jgi:hypothetical protein